MLSFHSYNFTYAEVGVRSSFEELFMSFNVQLIVIDCFISKSRDSLLHTLYLDKDSFVISYI